MTWEERKSDDEARQQIAGWLELARLAVDTDNGRVTAEREEAAVRMQAARSNAIRWNVRAMSRHPRVRTAF